MLYRVQYKVTTSIDSDGKPATITKTEGRRVDLGDFNESAENKKTHKAIRDVLQATHAKHQGVKESDVEITLTGVRRLVGAKYPEPVDDHWVVDEREVTSSDSDEDDLEDVADDDLSEDEDESFPNAGDDVEDDGWGEEEEETLPKPAKKKRTKK